jgi:amidohydrolase
LALDSKIPTKIVVPLDALPGIGHARGHNLIATSTLASAIGVETVMIIMQIPGTLIVMGTPAEETGGGKWLMSKAGPWKDCDMCVMTHGMATLSTPVCATKESGKLNAKFYGKMAHAAVAPWTGKNACDAIVMAYQGMSLLRQQIKKSDSIQGVTLQAGKGSNLIPDFAEGQFSVRSKNMVELGALKERFVAVFTAAAQATECTVELDW